jgi:tRNA pseudouridine38-40 synthase
VGRHDFAAFQGTGTDTATTERDVFSASVVRGGESLEPRAQAALVTCEITGSGFLRHMVRTIAGTLVDIGRGKREPEWIADVIASRRREQAGRTAPAEGLFLAEVRYETAPRGAEEPLAPNDG